MAATRQTCGVYLCVCTRVGLQDTMDDLAQTVMEQLRREDSASPFVVLATWKHALKKIRNDVLVRPITKNGVISYNVETQTWDWQWSVSHVDDENIQELWNPEKVCNFATSAEAARFLMFVAAERNARFGGNDRPCVRLSVGRFGPDLLDNNTPLDYWEAEPVADLIEMCGSMRPPLEA